jgi:septum formation protein
MTTGFIYLASASPRRRELLAQIGVRFRTEIPAVAETTRAGESPADYVRRVATDKADEVWDRVEHAEPAPVLAADTCVIVGSTICGKPRDEADALEMLALLSGRSHTVLTAVALRWQNECDVVLADSEVRFRATTAAERLAYCRTAEPYDKAGAYAIQGLAAVFVEHLQGSYSGVMGLPLSETARLLQPYGLPDWLAASVDKQ